MFVQSFANLFRLIIYGWLALESISYWHLSITAVGLLLKGGIASIAYSRDSLAIFDRLCQKQAIELIAAVDLIP